MKCDDESLEKLLEADDGSNDHAQVARHVDACERCQMRLVRLAADERDWHEAKHWLAQDNSMTRSIAGASDAEGEEYSIDEEACHWRSGHAPSADGWTEAMAMSLLSPPSHPEMFGRIGRYDVEHWIGSGGMGVVFKA
ncbi:MAG: serine/threonine protein kinase, partial [Planctomycetota bacterium]